MDEDTRAGDSTLLPQSPAGPPQDARARRMPSLGLAVAQEAIAHQEPGSLISRGKLRPRARKNLLRSSSGCLGPFLSSSEGLGTLQRGG